MNVAIDLKNLWLYGKGIGAFTTNLLQDLTLVEQQSAFCLQLYAPSFDQPALERWSSAAKFQRISTYSFNTRSRLSKLYYDQVGLLTHLRKHQADLLFSPYFDIPFGWNKKLITTVHDLSILEQRRNYGRAFFTYYQQLLKKAIRQSAFIVTVSGYSATKLQEVFNLPEDRIRIIYNKAPEAFQQVGSTHLEQAALRERYKLPAEFILYTGGIEARKNIPLLVEGWRQAASAAKDIPSLVVTGLNEVQRSDLLRRYPDCQHLLLLDFLPYEEIAMLYRMSSLVVNCSGYEGFGMPVLEALTMGVPMLCSDIPVYKEIGQDLVYYFRNGDQQDFSAQLMNFFSGTLPAIDREMQNKRAAGFNRREYGNLFYEMINQA